MELISKEDVIKITKKYDNTIYDAAMWCRKEIEELKTYTPLGSVLEKIKAEIENDWQLKKYPSSPFSCGLRRAIEIIDKYKIESEE